MLSIKDMSYEEFETLVEGLGVRLEVTWTIGGTWGASCWGGESNRPISPDPEPDEVELDAILEAICPDMKLFQYRKIRRAEDVVKVWDSSCGDYYGNSTNYRHRKIDLPSLYTAIQEVMG